MNFKQGIFLIVLFQSIMNVILIIDIFGLENLGLNWVNIVLLVLWNLSCSLSVGGMSYIGKNTFNKPLYGGSE